MTTIGAINCNKPHQLRLPAACSRTSTHKRLAESGRGAESASQTTGNRHLQRVGIAWRCCGRMQKICARRRKGGEPRCRRRARLRPNSGILCPDSSHGKPTAVTVVPTCAVHGLASTLALAAQRELSHGVARFGSQLATAAINGLRKDQHRCRRLDGARVTVGIPRTANCVSPGRFHESSA